MTFKCNICDKSFSRKSSLKRHLANLHNSDYYYCDVCGFREKSKKKLIFHLKRFHSTWKNCKYCNKTFSSRPAALRHEQQSCELRNQQTQGLSFTSDIMVYCNECKRFYVKKYAKSHLRSYAHLNSACVSQPAIEEDSSIELYQKAFDGKLVEYRILANSDDYGIDLEKFIKDHKQNIINLAERELLKLDSIKIQLTLIACFEKAIVIDDKKQFDELPVIKHFSSKFVQLYHGSDISEEITILLADILVKLYDLNFQDSGWIITEIVQITITIVQTSALHLKGCGFVPLTGYLKAKEAYLINIKNNGVDCLLYCISNVIFNIQHEAQDPISYENVLHKIELGGMNLPLQLKDIDKLEKLNKKFKLSINIYSYIKKKFGILRISKNELENHCNLLLINRGKNYHYVLIKNICKLFKPTRTSEDALRKPFYLCTKCLSSFTVKKIFLTHKALGCESQMLNFKHKYLRFQHHSAMQKHLFVISGDIEACLKKTTSVFNKEKNSKAISYRQQHKAVMAGYKISCVFEDTRFEDIRIFYGDNCIEQFFNKLTEDIGEFFVNYLYEEKEIFGLTNQMKAQLRETCTSCYVSIKQKKKFFLFPYFFLKKTKFFITFFFFLDLRQTFLRY